MLADPNHVFSSGTLSVALFCKSVQNRGPYPSIHFFFDCVAGSVKKVDFWPIVLLQAELHVGDVYRTTDLKVPYGPQHSKHGPVGGVVG